MTMIINAVKTNIVRAGAENIFDILDRHLPQIRNESIVAVSSKIISLCEGRVAPKSTDKGSLVKQEADFFLPKKVSQYGLYLTVARDTLIPNAGIDESNADNCYVLWPEDPQQTANEIRDWLIKKYAVKK